MRSYLGTLRWKCVFGVKCAELVQHANNLKQHRALRAALIDAFCPPPVP